MPTETRSLHTATEAAKFLQHLAEEVRQGRITKLNLSWDGGSILEVDYDYVAAEALNQLTLNIPKEPV